MEPIIMVRNIEHRRSDEFVLAVGQFDLLPGKIYCLVGPNGAGKSTLLNILALLTPPDQGEVLVEGEKADGAKQRQRLRQRITLVEQAPFLFDTTVYQNLAFGLRLREVRGGLQHHRILRALQEVGLSGCERRQARALSGGEAQRVALARAMVLKPKILLLDEPTDGLDRQSLPLFESCLISLAERGTTIVVATHDAGQPSRLGGELVRMEEGRTVPAPEIADIVNGNA